MCRFIRGAWRSPRSWPRFRHHDREHRPGGRHPHRTHTGRIRDFMST